jgi:hypothetical protein
MITILTYPDNSSTHYIDPNYIGNDSSGFQKRIKDFRDGNYLTLNTGTGPDNVDGLMEHISMFKYFLKYKSHSGNIAIYDIYQTPMVRGTVNSSGEITAVNIISYGNEQFRKRTGASTYVNSVRIKPGKHWRAGTSGEQTNTTDADVQLSQDSNGRLTNVALGTEHGAGYGPAGYVMFEIEQAAADTYPATPTLLEAQDVWDTADEWTAGGNATPTKYWPSVVTPQSAEISYKMPATITRSQSGKKYIQSAGYVKWGLEVTYPPMTANHFKQYHAIVQAARGQAIPMLFKLVQNTKNILFKNLNSGNSANALILKDPIDVSANSLVILLEGLDTGDTLNIGDTIFGSNGDANGQINTIISTANANVYGEAKVRLAYPVKTDQPTGSFWNTSPDEIFVTLNDSEFEYSVSTNGLYNVSVRFELDEWK